MFFFSNQFIEDSTYNFLLNLFPFFSHFLLSQVGKSAQKGRIASSGSRVPATRQTGRSVGKVDNLIGYLNI